MNKQIKLMNTIITTTKILALMIIVSCGSAKQEKSQTEFPPLLKRNEVLSKAPEWAVIQNKATVVFEKIKLDSNDLSSKLMLAQIYMQEARITGEHPYYYPAALTVLNNVLRNEPENFEALAFKASVLLSLHHFSEALEVGQKAAEINANNGFIYGVLCDANVELGNYEEAVKMSDKMQSLRPGLESYSRASYLREIYGQNQGAIEAMSLAYQAGVQGSEEVSWTGITLSKLYLNMKDFANAKRIAENVLFQRPTYAFAIEMLGKIELKNNGFDRAIQLFDSAIKIMPEVSFYESMAEAYLMKGNKEKFEEINKMVVEMLAEDAKSGHFTELELANTYYVLGEYKNAEKFATIEYKRRPKNIDVNLCMAKIKFKQNKVQEAKNYLSIALRTGKMNPEIKTIFDSINNSVATLTSR